MEGTGTVTIPIKDYNTLLEDGKTLTKLLKEEILYSDTCNGVYLVSITKDEAIQKLLNEIQESKDSITQSLPNYQQVIDENHNWRMERLQLNKTIDDLQRRESSLSAELAAIKSKWWYKLFGG